MNNMIKKHLVNVMGILMTICGIATFASYLQKDIGIVQATEERHDHYQDSWLSNIDSAVEEIDQPTLPAGASVTNNLFTLPDGIKIDPTENRQTFYIMDVSEKYKKLVDEASKNTDFPNAYITLSVKIVNNIVDETTVYARLVEKGTNKELETLELTKDSKKVGFKKINAHLADFQPKGGPKGDWRLFFSFENTSTMTFINISGGVPGASTVIYKIVADTKGRIGTQGKVEQQSETLWKAVIPKLITMKTRYMLADVENPTFDLSNKEKYENLKYDEKMFVQGNFNGNLGDKYTPMQVRNFKGYELFKETNVQPLVGDEYKVGEYYWNTAWAPYGLKELTKVTDITGSGSIEVYTVNPFTNVELIGDQETGYYAIKEDKLKVIGPKFFDTSHDNPEEFLKVYQTPIIRPGEYNTFIDSPDTAKENVQFKTDSNDQWVMDKKKWDFAAAYPVTYNGKIWARGTNESSKNETNATKKVPVYRTKSVDQKINADKKNPPLMNNGFYSKNTQIESDEEVLTANFVMPWRKNPAGIEGREGIGGTTLVAGNKGWMDPVVYPKGFEGRFGQKSVPLKNELIPHEPKVYYYVPQGKVFVQYKDEDGNTIKEQQTVIEEQNSGTDYNAGGSFQLPTITTEDGTIYEITPKVEYSSQRLKDIDTPVGTATEPEDGTDKITGKVIAATNQIITYIYKKVPATMTIQKSVTKITDKNDNEYKDQKYHTIGDKIYYAFEVTNTGKVTINEVTFNDELLGMTDQKVTVTIEPGKSYTYQVESPYIITQKDLQNAKGKIINIVKATATTPNGGKIPEVSSETETPVEPNPSIKLEKTADKTNLVVGETVTYTFTVTNTGNVTLTNVTATDDKLTPSTITLETTTLAPGETTTGTGTYVVTQTDVDNVKLVNTAKVTGLPPVTPENPTPTPVENEDQNIISNTSNPSIKLEKTADKTNLVVGETVTYTFTVTNTGNVT
ncbi:conserved repeat domain-containing protein, partial [Granulicatella balaenopterae]